MKISSANILEWIQPGEITEIADGVFALSAPFWGFPNVVYLIRSGSAWALVDTGIAETPQTTIGPFLEAHGGFDSLELVMGTHGHLDHVGGNGWVKKHAPRARFALGVQDVRWAEDVDRHYCQLYVHGFPGTWKPDAVTEEMVRAGCGEPVAIDIPLHGGEVLTFGDGREIHAIHLGAHTPGQTMYRDVQTNLVFTGDAIQNAGTFSAESQLRDFPMYGNPRDYRESLRIIRETPFNTVCTAHAGIFSFESAHAFLDESLAWVDHFTERLTSIATDAGDFSFEEIVERVGQHYFDYAVVLQIRVTTAEHLNELVADGILQPYLANGEKRWRTNV